MIRSCKKPPVYFPTVTGSICSFNSQYAGLPLKSCVSQISGYQEGSGTPSPDNVRPLHVWSGAGLTACGVNLFGGETMADYIVANVQNATKDTTNKTVTYTAQRIDGVELFNKFKANTRYTIFCYVKSGSYSNIKIDYSDNTSSNIPVNSLFVSDDNKTVVKMRGVWSSGSTELYYDDFGIFEGVLTDNDFNPYNGNTYTFTFGQSIFQGYIDWKRGVAVGIQGIVDLGIFSYTQYSTGIVALTKNNIQSATGLNPKRTSDLDMSCSVFSTDNRTLTATNNGIRFSTDVLAENFASTYNGQRLAFEIDTPIEIPLGGINLLTQEGQNNVFADCGDTTLEYLKAGR